MFYITNVSCRFLIWQPSFLKITRESLWEAEGLEEEAKVCFISLTLRFPLQFFSLQLHPDHRDCNVEASGIAVICSFHQAVPGSFQVVVPVRNI
jgi:hypothetical protein